MPLQLISSPRHAGILCLALVGACVAPGPASPVSADDTADDTADGAADDTGVELRSVDTTVVQADGRNVYTVSWDTPEPGIAEVAYGELGALDHVAVGTSSEDGLHHQVVLAGLAGGVLWTAMVDALTAGVHHHSDPFDLSPAAPEGLPALNVTTPPTDAVTGFALTVLEDDPNGFVAVLDRLGRYVWWQQVDQLGAFRALYDEGSRSVYWLANERAGSALWRSALDGQPETVVTLPRTHHDLTPDPDGGWYVLAYDERVVWIEGEDIEVVGDQLLHVSADGAAVTTVWTSWTEFPYTAEMVQGERAPEYPHTNSLSVDPETGLVLLSLYLADSVILMDPATGLAVWRMGGADSDWAVAEGGTFAHQHSPVLLDGGTRLVVFDNGSGERADPAQASIYALDHAALTATRTWTYDQGGVHLNITTGSAIPVGAEGSVLVAWGSDAVITQVSVGGEVEWQVEHDGEKFGYTSHLADFVGSSW